MEKYSITRLNTYRECPYKYKLQYIDRIEAPFVQNDNTFLGSMCHAALEWLYRERVNGVTHSEEELLAHYNALWDEGYDTERIKHADGQHTPDFFRLQGETVLSRYYWEFFVNDDTAVLGLETDDTLVLPDGNQFYIRIDKLAYRDGIYYVCDYKTDSRPKSQETADADEQLAMYALWVRRQFPNAKDVKLVWHMLKQTGDEATVTSSRTPEELEALEGRLVELIHTIETADEFPLGDRPRCNYCNYQPICPKFAQKKVLTIDDAKDLVDEYVANQSEIKKLQTRNDEIKKEIVGIASEGDYEAVSGTEYTLPVTRTTSVDSKSVDRSQMLPLIIREFGETSDYLAINYLKLNSEANKGTLDPRILEHVELKDSVSLGRSSKKKGEK